jgi:hypothetical protein
MSQKNVGIAGKNINTTDSGVDINPDVQINYSDCSPKSFIELLPSETGTVFAAILANIMTEGLTAQQKNILGNFISAVGALISYKASRDDIDEDKK